MAGVKYTDLLDSFLNVQSIAYSSKQTYRYSLKLFFEFLGDKDLTRTTVANYINELKEQKVQKNGKQKKLSENTISRRLTTIKVFTTWLNEEEMLADKEYKKIKKFKFKVDKGEDNRRALTPEEVERGMAKIANPILRMMFWTGNFYGIRRGEYIKLKVNNIDLDKRLLIIIKSKEGKTRHIRILKKHVPIWEQWFKTRESYTVDHDYVFFTDKGKAGTRTLERYFNKISEVIHDKLYKEQTDEERITSHTLRYTFAVKCWRGGMDLFVLSKILGHESLKTTETYLRVTEREILDTFEKQANKIF